MKKTLILFSVAILFLCITGCPRSRNLRNVSFSETVIIEGVSPQDLYRRISMWSRFTFNRTRSSIAFADSYEGRIVVRHIHVIPYGDGLTASVRSYITMELTNNGYRISFTDAVFQVYDRDAQPYGDETYIPSQEIADEILSLWRSMADDLKQVVGRFPDDF